MSTFNNLSAPDQSENKFQTAINAVDAASSVYSTISAEAEDHQYEDLSTLFLLPPIPISLILLRLSQIKNIR